MESKICAGVMTCYMIRAVNGQLGCLDDFFIFILGDGGSLDI